MKQHAHSSKVNDYKDIIVQHIIKCTLPQGIGMKHGMIDTRSGPWHLMELSVQSTCAATAWLLGQLLLVHTG